MYLQAKDTASHYPSFGDKKPFDGEGDTTEDYCSKACSKPNLECIALNKSSRECVNYIKGKYSEDRENVDMSMDGTKRNPCTTRFNTELQKKYSECIWCKKSCKVHGDHKIPQNKRNVLQDFIDIDPEEEREKWIQPLCKTCNEVIKGETLDRELGKEIDELLEKYSDEEHESKKEKIQQHIIEMRDRKYKCRAILASGSNKGKQCPNNCETGIYCGKHKSWYKR